MTLIEKMTEYHKIVFSTTEAAEQAYDALMNFVTTNAATIMTMVGPNRVIMWEEEAGPENNVLYLSAGAVRVLQGLHVALPNPQKIAAAALPDHRVLMLGDASDWDNK